MVLALLSSVARGDGISGGIGQGLGGGIGGFDGGIGGGASPGGSVGNALLVNTGLPMFAIGTTPILVQ